MVLKKSGFPEESELVQCTITSVQSHSVFVRMDEYGINGMIHISEVAPGRIRNIRDYVVEGKSVICKVMRVNPERGHVDLSLRRVSESQRRNKVNEMKKEKLAEKLVDVVASNLNMEHKKLYPLISEKVNEHFYLLFECFTEIVRGSFSISELKLPKNISDELKKVILDRLKPEVIFSKGKLSLESYASDGVEIIKETLKKAVDAGAEVKCLGGGTYSLSCKASNYKDAEAALDKSAKAAISYIKSKNSDGEFSEIKV
ncbi:translation initiation factor IF-2 subunit alpha [Candidatus Woesearchaeota archaeon]|nr:translation initiation factor IF-2 subunit alpha [Candidatus Woesearchaeota archaeon]|tara:strand:- start:22296 stop:23069 length:774 start_codon:yes stop_codon:yes gene_type:complete